MKGAVSHAYMAGRKARGDGTAGWFQEKQDRIRAETAGRRADGEGPSHGALGHGKATGLHSKWNEKPLEPHQ